MSADTQDMINQLQMQLATPPQPSLFGLTAPPDPSGLRALLQKLQAQQAVNQTGGTPGPYGYLHDAGQKAFAQVGQGLGAAIGGALNPPPTAAAQAATPQAQISSAIQSAQRNYQTLIGQGVAENTARTAVAKQMVSAGVPGAADVLAKSGQQGLEDLFKQAESAKDTAQGAAAQDESRHRLVDEAQGQARIDAEGKRLAIEQQNADSNRMRATFTAGADADSDAATVANAVAKIKAGMMTVPTGTFAKTPFGLAVVKGLANDPDYDMAKGIDRSKTVQQYTPGGSEGKALTAFNVALNHGDTLQGIADGLQNGDMRAVNAAKNIFGNQFGATGPTAVKLAAHLYSGEVQKTIIANGGTEKERAKVESAFSDVSTPDQMRIAIATANDLLVGKVGVSRQNWENHVATPTTPPDQFEKMFLSPTARRLTAGNSQYQGQFGAAPTSSSSSNSGWTVMPNGVRVRVKQQ